MLGEYQNTNASALVSVVMSVHDGIDLPPLEEAVKSILNQSYTNFEFIIVLDGIKNSDLKTYLESTEKLNKRVVLVHISENQGLAKAMNVAISKATGEYFIRMDADDISKQDRVKKLVEFMDLNKKIDICGSFIKEFYDDGSDRSHFIRYPTSHEQMKALFPKRNPLAHSTVIFRKSYFQKAGKYPQFSIRNEDTLLWLSGFVNNCRFANFPEVLYSVRVNRKMASRRMGLRKSFSDFVDRLRVIIDLKASWKNVFYGAAALLIQCLPYYFYGRIRYKVVSRDSDKSLD